MESNCYVPQADVMTGVYVPYCKNKMASEDLLTSHRTYLSVSQSVHFCLCRSMNILRTHTLPLDEVYTALIVGHLAIVQTTVVLVYEKSAHVITMDKHLFDICSL